MPTEYERVPVESTRITGAQKGNDLLRERLTITPNMGYHPGAYHLSFRECEQMRKSYTEAMLGVSPKTAEKLRSDEVDAMVYGVDWGDPAGSRSVAMTQMAEDMLAFRNNQSALDTLIKRLTDGELEQEMKFYMDTSAVWVAAYKEILKHPVRNWIRATWWMIRQLLRKK